MAEEVLTDDQIDQLLVEAEARLREKASQISKTANQDEIGLDTAEGEARATRARKPYV